MNQLRNFRKKPVVIQAIQFDGTIKCAENIRGVLNRDDIVLNIPKTPLGNNLIIPTLEGDMIASPDDWIIVDVKNEIYPCKPDVFERTYEEVEETHG